MARKSPRSSSKKKKNKKEKSSAKKAARGKNTPDFLSTSTRSGSKSGKKRSRTEKDVEVEDAEEDLSQAMDQETEAEKQNEAGDDVSVDSQEEEDTQEETKTPEKEDEEKEEEEEEEEKEEEEEEEEEDEKEEEEEEVEQDSEAEDAQPAHSPSKKMKVDKNGSMNDVTRIACSSDGSLLALMHLQNSESRGSGAQRRIHYFGNDSVSVTSMLSRPPKPEDASGADEVSQGVLSLKYTQMDSKPSQNDAEHKMLQPRSLFFVSPPSKSPSTAPQFLVTAHACTSRASSSQMNNAGSLNLLDLQRGVAADQVILPPTAENKNDEAEKTSNALVVDAVAGCGAHAGTLFAMGLTLSKPATNEGDEEGTCQILEYTVSHSDHDKSRGTAKLQRWIKVVHSIHVSSVNRSFLPCGFAIASSVDGTHLALRTIEVAKKGSAKAKSAAAWLRVINVKSGKKTHAIQIPDAEVGKSQSSTMDAADLVAFSDDGQYILTTCRSSKDEDLFLLQVYKLSNESKKIKSEAGLSSVATFALHHGPTHVDMTTSGSSSGGGTIVVTCDNAEAYLFALPEEIDDTKIDVVLSATGTVAVEDTTSVENSQKARLLRVLFNPNRTEEDLVVILEPQRSSSESGQKEELLVRSVPYRESLNEDDNDNDEDDNELGSILKTIMVPVKANPKDIYKTDRKTMKNEREEEPMDVDQDEEKEEDEEEEEEDEDEDDNKENEDNAENEEGEEAEEVEEGNDEMIAERLEALNEHLHKSDDVENVVQTVPSSNTDEKTATDSSPRPNQESLAVVLLQAMHSSDETKVEFVLGLGRDERVIQRTIDQLETVEDVLMLLHKLVHRIEKKPSRAEWLGGVWVSKVLTTHGRALLQHAAAVQKKDGGGGGVRVLAHVLGPLKKVLVERTEVLPDLMRLQGRLNMLKSAYS